LIVDSVVGIIRNRERRHAAHPVIGYVMNVGEKVIDIGRAPSPPRLPTRQRKVWVKGSAVL
jgi:hypothetical protein